MLSGDRHHSVYRGSVGEAVPPLVFDSMEDFLLVKIQTRPDIKGALGLPFHGQCSMGEVQAIGKYSVCLLYFTVSDHFISQLVRIICFYDECDATHAMSLCRARHNLGRCQNIPRVFAIHRVLWDRRQDMKFSSRRNDGFLKNPGGNANHLFRLSKSNRIYFQLLHESDDTQRSYNH